MKIHVLTFLLLLIYSCCDSKRQDTIANFDEKLLIGEWKLDSSSNRNFSRDRLILLKNGTFYLFSGSDGGSLLATGKKEESNTFTTNAGETLAFKWIDINRLCITGEWSGNQNFYKRLDYGDYQKALEESLKADALRKKLMGWWKLTAPKMPVKLINYTGSFKQFTLNIRDDGKAVFYLENNLDSAVVYSYKVNPDGIDFNRGCVVGSDCKVSMDKTGEMKLILDRTTNDILILKRLTEIN